MSRRTDAPASPPMGHADDPPPIEPAPVGTSVAADEILKAIRKIVQGITLHSKALYKSSGLTMPQLLCMRVIEAADDDEVTAAEVARQIRLSPATVTGIVDRLERNGLVVRERRSKDRRKVCLSMTEAGHAKLAALHSSVQDRFVQRVEGLSAAERDAILRSLTRVVEMLDASAIDASPILAPGGDVKNAVPPGE